MTVEFICFFPVVAFVGFVGFQVVVSRLKWLEKTDKKKTEKKRKNNK